MKLWTSSETSSDFYESFRIIRNKLEADVNMLLTTSNYGNGIDAWDVIFIIQESAIMDTVKFNRKERTLDAKIYINDIIFKKSNDSEKRSLLLDALILSVIQGVKKYKIEDFMDEKLIESLKVLKSYES